MKKLTTELFIDKANKKHNNKFDYSKSIYTGAHKKLIIICKKCGKEWLCSPNAHLNGSKCANCSRIKQRITPEEFIAKAILKHGNKFDYSEIVYQGARKHVKNIICNKCGQKFGTVPFVHLQSTGCPKCTACKVRPVRLTHEQFLKKATKKHGLKYEYLEKYNRTHMKINIFCKTCNKIFKQTPANHLNGQGCRKCGNKLAGSKNSLSLIEFEKRCYSIYGNSYTYFQDFKNLKSLIKVHCNTCNNEYKIYPNAHLRGNGCRICSLTLGEQLVKKCLDELNIVYETQYSFIRCMNKKRLKFDFYLPKYNYCIEYDGAQHFIPIEKFGGIEAFIINKKRDKIKNTFCKQNNIKLIRIPYWKQDKIKQILKKELKS